MTMSRAVRRTIGQSAVAGIAAALIAACGSSGGGGSSTSATGGSSTGAQTGTHTRSAPSKSPVHIGLVNPEDSSVISLPDVVAAERAAVRGLNQRGGLAGHPVVLDYCNDKADPNQTAICGRQLVSDHVIADVGGTVLNGPLLTPILKSAGIPEVGIDAVSGTDFSSPDVYLVNGGVNLATAVLTAWAAHQKIPTSLAVVDVTAAAPLATLMEQTAKQAGMPLSGKVLVSPTQLDFGPVVETMKSQGAKAVLSLVSTGQESALISANKTSGTNLTLLTSALQPGDAKVLGPSIKDVVSALPAPPLDSSNPVVKLYLKDLKAEATTGDAAAKVPTTQGFLGWFAVYSLQRVIQTAGISDLTASTVTHALNTVKNVTTGGVIPPWTPNKPGPSPFPRVSNSSYYIVRYHSNGKAYELYNKPVTLSGAIADQFR